MVKKEENRFASALREFGTSFLLGRLKNLYSDFLNKIQNRINKAQKNLMKIFYFLFISLIGLIFLLVGIIFLWNDYFKLSFGWDFFIIGLIVFFISFLMKLNYEKKLLMKKEDI